MSVDIWTDEHGVEFIRQQAKQDGGYNCTGCCFYENVSLKPDAACTFVSLKPDAACTFDRIYPDYVYPEADNKPCVDGDDEYIFIKN